MKQGKRIHTRAMKHPDDDIPSFHALLEHSRPDDWKMSRRTYYRWLSGELSEAIDILIANPALLSALARDIAKRRGRVGAAEDQD